jgi:hypothetical protein
VSRLDWCPVERIDELQAFIDRHWKAGHVLSRDRELLRWQHPHPSDDRLSVLVADGPEGGIVGILGIIPAGFCARGERLGASWLTTWVVRPEARGDQVGLRLLTRVMAETDGLVATLGGNETTMRILRSLRFHTIASVPRWVRPGSLDALDALLGAAGQPDRAAYWRGWRPPRSQARAAAGGVRIVPWSEDGERWDRLWARLSRDLVGTWRDADYLRWRYLAHPRFEYQVRLAERDGEVVALLAYRRQPVSGVDADVVRVLEAIGDEDAVARLAAEAVDAVSDDRLALIDFYCTGARFGAALERVGFTPEPAESALPSLFAPLDARRARLTGAFWSAAGGGADALFAGPDTYFTRSDCDQDRPN